MSFGFDFSALNGLAADLGASGPKVIHNVRLALEDSAQDVDDDWTEEAKDSNPSHAKSYPKSITTDLELDRDGSMSAVIGPDLSKRQGTLGILEDASGDVTAAPQGNARKALRKNLSRFEGRILDATEGTL